MEIDDALDGVEALVRTDFDPQKPRRLTPFIRTLRQSRVPVSRDQHLRLVNIVVELLGRGFSKIGPFSTLEWFADTLFDAGYRSVEWAAHAEQLDPKKPDKLAIMFQLAVETLNKTGLISSAKNVELIDFGDFGIGYHSGRARIGVVLLTKKRVLVVGEDDPRDRSCYILYPDIEEKDYYGSLEYLDLELIDRVETVWERLHKKVDLWSDRVEYLRTSPRHLYGPLFFKMKLADKVQVRTGKFRVQIFLRNFKDKDRLKERLETWEDKIRIFAEESKIG